MNCSAEDIAKIIVPKDAVELHAKHTLKAFNAILPQRILLKAKNLHTRGKAGKEDPEEPHENAQDRYRQVRRQAD